MSIPLEEIDLQAPDSLRQMIETQIDRLNEEELRALEAASIVGVTFSTAITAAAANMDAEEFENVCERLLRRHQIVRLADSPQFVDGSFSENYQFIHALYREVLYQRQSPRRRTRVHLLVGERLEAHYAQRLSEAAAELAHHFEQGGDWLRAIRYWMLAANTACRRFEPNQGARILEHALELVGRIPESGPCCQAKSRSSRSWVLFMLYVSTLEPFKCMKQWLTGLPAVVSSMFRCALFLPWHCH